MATDSNSESKTGGTGVVRERSPHADGGGPRVAIPVGPTSDEAEVQVIRQENQIRAIEVTCTCGRRTRILCEYE